LISLEDALNNFSGQVSARTSEMQISLRKVA